MSQTAGAFSVARVATNAMKAAMGKRLRPAGVRIAFGMFVSGSTMEAPAVITRPAAMQVAASMTRRVRRIFSWDMCLLLVGREQTWRGAWRFAITRAVID